MGGVNFQIIRRRVGIPKPHCPRMKSAVDTIFQNIIIVLGQLPVNYYIRFVVH